MNAKTENTKTETAAAELLINGVKVTETTKIAYRENPKRPNSRSWERYEAYQKAKTIGEYLKLNDSKFAKADLRHDLGKEFLTIVK